MRVETGKKISVHEVAPRDGFQIEPTFIPTEAKIELINELGKTGLPVIEATSFTSPKAIPALRDAEDVMRGITRAPGVTYTALVPNMRGRSGRWRPAWIRSTSSCPSARRTTWPTSG